MRISRISLNLHHFFPKTFPSTGREKMEMKKINRKKCSFWKWKSNPQPHLRLEKQEESLDDEEREEEIVIKFKWFHSRSEPEEECNLVEEKISILKITKFLSVASATGSIKMSLFPSSFREQSSFRWWVATVTVKRIVTNWNVNVVQSLVTQIATRTYPHSMLI